MEIKEIWKTIENYPDYQVSSLGRVKSLGNDKSRKEKILKQTIDKGYLRVNLYKEKKLKTHNVHRLVATAFIPNPNNLPQVNHKDENPSNNCSDNLEWCTAKYNINYGTRNERSSKALSIALKGKPNLALSKPIVQIHKSGLIIGVYDSASQASKELNINHSHICKCCNGKRKTCGGFKWVYLEENKKVS